MTKKKIVFVFVSALVAVVLALGGFALGYVKGYQNADRSALRAEANSLLFLSIAVNRALPEEGLAGLAEEIGLILDGAFAGKLSTNKPFTSGDLHTRIEQALQEWETAKEKLDNAKQSKCENNAL